MNYLSPEFALFFLLFFPLYWASAKHVQLQKALFLAASYGLYATWNWRFSVMLMVFSTLLWIFAVAMARSRRPWLRTTIFTTALLLCLGYLGMLKYFDFFREGLQEAFGALGLKSNIQAMDLLLPIGVSFYTFNAITFLAAIARKERESAGSLADFLLYMAFFPSLLAGPILRPENILRQVESTAPRQLIEPAFALWLIYLGVFKKLVLASWLAALWVNPVFADPSAFNGVDLAIGAAAYSLQIFFDFSGYTDVVTGIALLLGYRLPLNFRQPYLAGNLKLFWQRWHISLSSFIRDYLYRPLGGNSGGMARTQLNVLIAFALSGLWHGADSRYLLWGLLHGLGLVVCNLWIAARMPRLPVGIGSALTFSFVSLAWILFRADSFAVALDYFNALGRFDIPFQFNFVLAAALLAAFFLLSAHSARIEGLFLAAMRRPSLLLRCGYAIGLTLVLLELAPAGVPAFIYFKY